MASTLPWQGSAQQEEKPLGWRTMRNVMEEKIFREGYSFSGYERDKLFMNVGKGPFLDVSPVSGVDSPADGRAVVVADFDNDGAADLFVHNLQTTRHTLYRNLSGRRNRWLRLVLEGRKSNRQAIGALVTARLPESTGSTVAVTLTRAVECGSGLVASHDKRLLFGLGQADRVTSLEVRWPSGLVQKFGELAAGRTYRLIEGEPQPRPVELPVFALGEGRDREAASRSLAKLPDLGLRTLEGRLIGTKELTGRWALVNVWSPRCKPCMTELPELQRMAAKYGARLQIVGIALVPAEQRAEVESTIARFGLTYPNGLAHGDMPQRLFGTESAIAIPASFLVDPEGTVHSVYLGTSDMKRLQMEVSEAVGGN